MAESKDTVEDDLLKAIRNHNVAMVKDCLDRGASPVFCESTNESISVTFKGKIPIYMAVAYPAQETPEIIELLVKYKEKGQTEEVFSFKKLDKIFEKNDKQKLIYKDFLEHLKHQFEVVRNRNADEALTSWTKKRIEELKKIIRCLVFGGFNIDKLKIDLTGTQFEKGLENKKITIREFLSLPDNDRFGMREAFDAAEADRQQLVKQHDAKMLKELSTKTADIGAGKQLIFAGETPGKVSGFLRGKPSGLLERDTEERWAFLNKPIRQLYTDESESQSSDDESKTANERSPNKEDSHESESQSSDDESKTAHERSSNKEDSHKKAKGSPQRKR